MRTPTIAVDGVELPERMAYVVMAFRQGMKVAEAARQLGIPNSTASEYIKKAKELGVGVSPPTRGNIGVVARSLIDGTIIEFDSYYDAVIAGYNACSIRGCVDGKQKRYADNEWWKKGCAPPPVDRVVGFSSKGTIEDFRSLWAARHGGYDPSMIKLVVAGKRKTYAGLNWKIMREEG